MTSHDVSMVTLVDVVRVSAVTLHDVTRVTTATLNDVIHASMITSAYLITMNPNKHP